MGSAALERLNEMAENIEEEARSRFFSIRDHKWRMKTDGKLDDTGLRLYQKNWYFGYYLRDCVWPATNFNRFPEFRDEPVM
jgi:hypothetical protein